MKEMDQGALVWTDEEERTVMRAMVLAGLIYPPGSPSLAILMTGIVHLRALNLPALLAQSLLPSYHPVKLQTVDPKGIF